MVSVWCVVSIYRSIARGIESVETDGRTGWDGGEELTVGKWGYLHWTKQVQTRSGGRLSSMIDKCQEGQEETRE
jgi:hypothetical protein